MAAVKQSYVSHVKIDFKTFLFDVLAGFEVLDLILSSLKLYCLLLFFFFF